MKKTKLVIMGALIVAISFCGTILAVESLPTNQGFQTVSNDIELLKVSNPSGAFLSVPPANFTSAFSFSPGKTFVQVNSVLLTLVWDQLSKGHIGDRLVSRINAGAPSIFTMNILATKVVALNAADVRVGANTLDMGLIPVISFPTTDNTNYSLFEVRLTIEYTISG